MRFENVAIESVVSVAPPRVVKSTEIEARLRSVYARLKLPEGRLEMMTGIRERRFWEPGTRPSTAAALAGRAALEKAGRAPREIDCLVHAAVCRDFLEPATAAVVHGLLGLPPATAIFDLSNACLGMLNAIVMLGGLIEAGQIERGLIVSGETAEGLHEATVRDILDDETLTRNSFKRHFASLTIGSGAAAIVIGRADRADAHRVLGGAVMTDSTANELCRENVGGRLRDEGPLMTTDAEALLNAGVDLAEKTWCATRAVLGWSNGDVDRVFTHQVGRAHRKLLLDRLGLDEARDFPTVEDFGNTGSAALPTAFARGIEEGKVAPGDNIALLGIGSGLSSLMLGVRW